jgi:hypothetical protein
MAIFRSSTISMQRMFYLFLPGLGRGGGSEISLYNICGYYGSNVLPWDLLSLGPLQLSLVWRCVMLRLGIVAVGTCSSMGVLRWPTVLLVVGCLRCLLDAVRVFHVSLWFLFALLVLSNFLVHRVLALSHLH